MPALHLHNLREMTNHLSIQDRAAFDMVRYANCWEDADILLEALAVKKGDRCLSIASAGDNSLALLASEPDVVVACDVNAAQLACVEIRQVAFAELCYADLLAFLGFRDCEDRLAIYRALRSSLCPSTKLFFDRNQEHIASGLIHNGKFERYVRFFRSWILPLVHSRNTVDELLRDKDEAARRAFFRERWDTRRWRLVCRIFCSRPVLGRAGRDPEFMRFVEGHVAERIVRRAAEGLTNLPTHDNPFLDYICTGTFSHALPFYVREENYPKIRRNLSRLKLFHGAISDVFKVEKTGFDKFNLSDIFEYMSHELFLHTARVLLEHARPSARLAYWNMLVPRGVAPHWPQRVRQLQELSESCFRRDKAFFYQAFHVDEVV